jgi:photosystem II stability/assembly factor-like uncharacterized protein
MLSVASVVIGAGTAWAGINGGTSIGPDGGPVLSLVMDTQNPRTLYAGTFAGVFKSIDGGATWNNSGLAGFMVSNLAIDSQNPGTIYAALGVFSVGVFKSSDGGENWREVDSGLPSDCRVNALAVHPQRPSTVFAVTSWCGVFKSTSGGESWNAVNSGLPALTTSAMPLGNAYNIVGALAIDPQTPSTLYVVVHRCDPKSPYPGCDSRVFESTDEGQNWSEATSVALSGNWIYSLAIDPRNASTLYARGPFGPDNQNGVFRSADGGKTWTRTSVDLGVGVGSSNLLAIDSQGTIYASGSRGFFKSADGGATWSAISFAYVTALVLDPRDPSSMHAVYSYGVYRSQDGGASWSAASSGLRANGVYSLAIDPQSPDTLYAGTSLAFFKSTDRGKHWTASSPWMPFYYGAVGIAIDPKNSSNLYAGSGGGDGDCGGLFRSADAGMNWTNIGFVDCISALLGDPHDPGTVYLTTASGGLAKINGLDGESWTEINYGIRGTVTALALDPQNSQILYAGVGSTLFKTTDGGMTWNPTALTVEKSLVSALTIDPQNSNTVYAVTATTRNGPGGLWKSLDGGLSWRDLSASLPFPVYTVIANPKNPATIYTGTDFAVMMSTDAGETWVPLTSDMGPARLLVFDPKSPTTLYAAGSGGLFEIPISASLNVTSIGFDVSVVKSGATFNATIAGPNLTGQAYFDVQVRAPGNTTDIVIENWQTGTSAPHSVGRGTATGTWTISGVRAHQIETDHTGNFVTVSATLTVAP